jgi:excisionase family DNA binding protein
MPNKQRLAALIAELIQGDEPAAVEAPAPAEEAASEPLAYRVPEALKMLSISRTLFYREVSEGRIRVVHVGRRVLVRREELKRYLLEAEQAQA